MNHILTHLSDPRLGEVIDQLWFEHYKYYGSTADCEILADPFLKVVNLKCPHPFFNCVFLARLTPELLDQKINQARTYFQEWNLPFHWRIGPCTRPPDLGEHLEAYGLNHLGDMPGMAVELQAMNEEFSRLEGFTIEQVRDLGTLRQQVKVLMTGFGFEQYFDRFLTWETGLGFDLEPSRRLYIGYLDRVPVASAVLLLSHGVASIFNVATLPEARGRGIGTAITLAALREGREAGYQLGVIHSSKIGLGVYRRIGFEEVCKISKYGRSEDWD